MAFFKVSVRESGRGGFYELGRQGGRREDTGGENRHRYRGKTHFCCLVGVAEAADESNDLIKDEYLFLKATE